jgi:cell division protein FtsB
VKDRLNGLNARAVALAVVFFMLALLLAAPAQRYFAQRAQISALQHELSANEQRVQQARTELERWRDPAYIKAQARARLHFVMPGETQYIVIDNGKTKAASSKFAQNGTGLPAQAAWYQRLISSVQLVANVGSTSR